MIRSPDQVITISLCGVSPPAFVRLFDGRRYDFAPLHKSAHFLQFALHIVLASAAHLPDYRARFGQVSVKSQEIHPVPKRVNVRFVVQGQADRGNVFFDLRAAILQIGFIFVYQEEIVHISSVVFNAKLFLDEVI